MKEGKFQDEMTDFIRAIIDMPLEDAERVIDNLTRDTRIFTGHCRRLPGKEGIAVLAARM